MKLGIKFQILMLCFVILIDSLGWGAVFPVFDSIYIKNNMHMLSSSVSLSVRNLLFEISIGIYSLFMFLSSPFLGKLSDFFGRKKVLLISIIGSFFGIFLCAIAIIERNFYLIFLGRAIWGITAGNLGVTQAAIVDLSTPKTLPNHMRLNTMAVGLGFTLGPVFSGFLMKFQGIGHYQYVLPLIVMAMIMFLSALLVFFFFIETAPKPEEGEIKAADLISNYIKLIRLPFSTKIRYLFLILLLFMISRTIFFGNLPLIFNHRYLSSSLYVSYVLGYFSLLLTFSLLFIFPIVTKKMKLPDVIRLTFILQLVGYLIFSIFSNITIAWISLGWIALSLPFVYVSLVSFTAINTPKEEQGSVMGIVGSLAALTWGVGPILAGILMHFGALFVYAAVLFLLSISWYYFKVIFCKVELES